MMPVVTDSGDSMKLVTVDEMASLLRVPKSWLYERTRQGQSAIPHLKLGLYVRFDPKEVITFFKAKELGYHA